MIENLVKDLRISTETKILSPIVDLKEKNDWDTVFEQLGGELGCKSSKIKEATKKTEEAQKDFHAKLQQGFLPTEIFKGEDKQGKSNDLVIGIAGHSYLLYDSYLSLNLIAKIRKMGAYLLTPEMISCKEIKKAVATLPKPLFWNYQKETFGAVWNWCQKQKVDGIIHLPSFPCGPDSVMGTFIDAEAKRAGIPLMHINIDEQSAEAGVRTRIEAFVDMIQRKKSSAKKIIQSPQATSKSRVRIPGGEIIVSFPRMGRDTHLTLKYIFDRLGVECIIPPPTTEKTLKLGVEYSPETICLPLKVNMGNYIQVLEKGANVLIHAGGCGPCRFGFYGPLAELILKEELGYNFQFKILEPPGAQGVQVFADFFRFFNPGKIAPFFLPATGKIAHSIASFLERPWIELLALTPHDRILWQIIKTSFLKKRAFDFVDKKVLGTRCYEIFPGDTLRAYKKAIGWIDQAYTISEIEEAQKEALKLIENVDQDRSYDVLRVGLVGEFFILLEPFINFDIENWLGKRGVYIEKGIYASDFIAPTKENVVGGIHYDTLSENAKPYLNYKVGGEGLPTIGHTVLCAKHGFDGIIHLMPFTCMPETVAKQILPRVSQEENIPILSLVIDEQTGKAGVETRLEAFIDLMRNRRELVKGGRKR
jgi:predicted nucleotide-binding protein (sugar kinase/HSP70/actin superfamily)